MAVLAIVAMLPGCAAHAPKVIEVPRDRYVPIPAALSAACDIPKLELRTVGGAIELAVKLRGSLEICNDKLAAIRAIQGVPVK